MRTHSDSAPRDPAQAGAESAPVSKTEAQRQKSTSRGPARLEQLIDFLDDESPRVWSTIRGQLIRHDARVEPVMRSLVRSGTPRQRARARQILLDRQRRHVAKRLAAYLMRSDLRLEDALFLMSRLESPQLDIRPYHKALDAMGRELKRRLAQVRGEGAEAARGHANALGQYLGTELGYSGPESDYHHPGNIFLHRTIERRAGMPLTLCALYQAVARRANLHASLIPLPGHVLLRVHSGRHRCLLDPFHRGEERSEQQCLHYLADHGLSFHPSWFADAPAALLALRHLNNLRASWSTRGLQEEVQCLDWCIRAIQANPSLPRQASPLP